VPLPDDSTEDTVDAYFMLLPDDCESDDFEELGDSDNNYM
jgi:hypothetical protein